MNNDVLISKNELIKKVVVHMPPSVDSILPYGYVHTDDIHNAPAVAYEPIINAAWILNISEHGKMFVVCGECDHRLSVIITDSSTGKFKPPKRCHECGAHMTEVIEYDARV